MRNPSPTTNHHHSQQQPVLGPNAWGAEDDFDDDNNNDHVLEDADDAQEEFASADATLPPEETCARIEALAAEHVRGVLGLSSSTEERGGRGGGGGGGRAVVDHRGGEDCDHEPPPVAAAALEFTVAAGRQGAVLADSSYRVPTSATARVRLHDARRRVPLFFSSPLFHSSLYKTFFFYLYFWAPSVLYSID